MKNLQKSNGVAKLYAHLSTKFHTSVKAALKVGFRSIISDFFSFGVNPSWNQSPAAQNEDQMMMRRRHCQSGYLKNIRPSVDIDK